MSEVYFDDFKITHQKLVPDNALSADGIAYRYGFNGKEKDQSKEFGMNHYDYGFRIYNPAVGRFLSVDPLTKSYPMLTPYQFASNRPIDGIDLDGLELLDYRSMWNVESITQPVLGTYYFGKPANNRTVFPMYHKKNNISIGNPEFGRSINGEFLSAGVVKESIYDPTPTIFNDTRININAADRTRKKIINLYATPAQTRALTKASLISKGIKEGSILIYNWTNAEKDDAMYDLAVNSNAIETALELVYKALNNTNEESLEDVYSYFDKDEVELVKDLSTYLVDHSISGKGNAEYRDYIKTTGDKILDSYKGRKNQKRKSKVGTKKDIK